MLHVYNYTEYSTGMDLTGRPAMKTVAYSSATLKTKQNRTTI